jgi:hypothetical protein
MGVLLAAGSGQGASISQDHGNTEGEVGAHDTGSGQEPSTSPLARVSKSEGDAEAGQRASEAGEGVQADSLDGEWGDFVS